MVSVLEKFHCSLASQTHFCNKREGSGELCIHKPYLLYCTVWFNHAALLWHMTHCNVSVAITVWTIIKTKTQDIIFTTAGAVADLRGVKGVQIPLWWLVMYFAYIFARVHKMIIQQWHAATTTRHSYTLRSLLISRRLSRPRVASRYSVRTSSYFTS